MAIVEFINEDQYRKDILYSPTDLSAAFANQAALYAYYSEQARKATQQAGAKKQFCEIQEAKLDKAIRDAAATAGEKTTEPGIKQKIVLSPEYIRARKDQLDAEAYESLCRNYLEAFRHRKDMLIQAGASAREEYKGELRMNHSNIDEYRERHAAS